MNCPVCNVELRMADRQGVEIDYCPKCRGVWLDRGELDKIIERSVEALDDDWDDRYERGAPRDYGTPMAPERREYDREHGGQYRKKRRSFLGELFDFD